MKTLSDFKLKNKTVLLRADINSDVVDGKVLIHERIKECASSINFLKKKGAKIVILAHQGRPNRKDFVSLRQHAKYLSRFTKVKFVADITGTKARVLIKNLRQGEALLLENVRFEKDEYKPEKGKKNKLMTLLPLIDIYVNDAFSNCHRNQSSMILFPKYVKSCVGPLLVKELRALKKIKLKNTLFILGGGKPEDNLRLLGKNKVLACGFFGQMCLIAKGKNLGAQNKYLKKIIKNYHGILNKLKRARVINPLDFAVKVNSKRKELDLSQFPSKYEIFDIGSKTQQLFVKEIRKAKTIYMKGPAGFCGYKQFCNGTFSLLRAIAQNKGFSLLGGGHLSDAVKKSKINKNKFGYISLSGGALLRYIKGEKLPGLEVLK